MFGSLALRRQAAGVMFQTSYTYGKVLTDAEVEQGVTSYYDANNRNLDRSLASFDARHRVAFRAMRLSGTPALRRKDSGIRPPLR